LFALPNGSKGDEDAASLCEEVGLEISPRADPPHPRLVSVSLNQILQRDHQSTSFHQIGGTGQLHEGRQLEFEHERTATGGPNSRGPYVPSYVCIIF